MHSTCIDRRNTSHTDDNNLGVVMAALLFMKRMAETADIKAWKYTDSPDITPGEAEKLRDIPK